MNEQRSANLKRSDFAVEMIVGDVLNFLSANLAELPQGEEGQKKIQELIKDTLLLAAQNPDATKKAVQRMYSQK